MALIPGTDLGGHLGFLRKQSSKIESSGINGFLDPKNLPKDTNFIALCHILCEIRPKIAISSPREQPSWPPS